jgi:hypothetical protein
MNFLLRLLVNAFSLFFDMDCSFAGPLEGPCSGLHRYAGGMRDALSGAATIGPYLRYRNLVGKDDKQNEKIEALAG